MYDPTVYVQGALDTPESWLPMSASAFAGMPKKALPRGGELIDDAAGWVTSINLQGMQATADHYAVLTYQDEDYADLVTWIDDPEDYPEAWFVAHWIRFWQPTLVNTKIRRWMYAGQDYGQAVSKGGPLRRCELLPFDQFRPPPDRFVRHGVWMPHEKHRQHEHLRGNDPHGWQEHINPTDRTIAGGTITYLLNAPDTVDSSCMPAVDHNNKMDEAGQTNETLAANLGGGVSKITHAFTTVAGDPNSADWPAASGGDPYFCSVNCSQLGTDVTFGMLGQGSANGEFVRVNSSCTRQEGQVQTEGQFTAVGVANATAPTWDPSSGAASDRFQCRWAAVRAANHGNQAFDIDTDSSSDAGGPWSIAGDVGPPPPLQTPRFFERRKVV